ncbi:hypothetical protein ALC53_11145 [Atta colombica]|uniref:Uncharacterized protein n=1 Tax=Atta colombica TaxID=520822 RepID=A0A195B2I1_9HYME|nr:hypothetical protein ALC53_11145 [Atta colombica]
MGVTAQAYCVRRTLTLALLIFHPTEQGLFNCGLRLIGNILIPILDLAIPASGSKSRRLMWMPQYVNAHSIVRFPFFINPFFENNFLHINGFIPFPNSETFIITSCNKSSIFVNKCDRIHSTQVSIIFLCYFARSYKKMLFIWIRIKLGTIWNFPTRKATNTSSRFCIPKFYIAIISR